MKGYFDRTCTYLSLQDSGRVDVAEICGVEDFVNADMLGIVALIFDDLLNHGRFSW